MASFFTPKEREWMVLFVPRDWPRWWQREPLLTKVVIGAVALITVVGLFLTIRGYRENGLALLLLSAVLFSIVLFFALLHVVAATLRWFFRVTGIAALWRRIQGFVIVVATIAAAIWLLAICSPYLSLNLELTWYAIKTQIPVDRIVIDKEPHDCEFSSAPFGSKNCHYDTQPVLWVDDSGQRHLTVEYTKVDD